MIHDEGIIQERGIVHDNGLVHEKNNNEENLYDSCQKSTRMIRETSIQELKRIQSQPNQSSLMVDSGGFTIEGRCSNDENDIFLERTTTAKTSASRRKEQFPFPTKHQIEIPSTSPTLSDNKTLQRAANTNSSFSDTILSAACVATDNELETLILNKVHEDIEDIEDDLSKRANQRQMTTAQEVYNAISMLPTFFLAFYFVVGGTWLTDLDIAKAEEELMVSEPNGTYLVDSHQCISCRLFPSLYAFPPLPILSIAFGIMLHTPCSMYYHLLCAFKIPPGPKRMDHWSRRLDQTMIHFISLFSCYGTSGSFDYMLIALAFSLDSMYRLFQNGHRPKRILIRMILACLMPIAPLVTRGLLLEFMQLLVIYGLSGWLFSAYPIKGWSHGTFHLLLTGANPIFFKVSASLSSSQEAISIAAKCALLAQS